MLRKYGARHFKALLLVFTAFAVNSCTTDVAARRTMDKASVKEMVAREAVNMGVPVSLALAVAHAESSFDPQAESHAGARGVMQIMPATAKSEYGIRPERLWNPRLNVRIGLHFLGRLVKRYRGRVDLALSYYNGGSRVGVWPNARVIPATAKYVLKVQNLQRHYRARLAQGRRI
jgi:soluble lytic murein transglycosylase-like protein